MKKRIITFSALFSLAITLLFLWNRIHENAQGGNAQGNKFHKTHPREGISAKTNISNDSLKQKLSNASFNVLRVELPPPKPIAWEGPFYDSVNFLNAENANAAREALPGWIRKAVRAGDNDRAAGYLYSLLCFLKSDNYEHRIETALSLLRLGYKDKTVLDILSASLESNRYMGNVLTPASATISERQATLDHLLFFQESTLNDHIEFVFNKYQAKGDDVKAILELAKYLEAAGRPRSDDFWLSQIKSGGDLDQSVAILQKRNNIELIPALKAKIEADSNSYASLEAAAIIYGMSGDSTYESRLIKVVEESIQIGYPSAGLNSALYGLLKGKSPQAEAEVKRVLTSENLVLQEMALSALGRVPNSSSIQTISDYATPIIEKKLLPTAAFKALIAMGTQEGDDAYEALKRTVLARGGRSEADFYTLEFWKEHRSQLAR